MTIYAKLSKSVTTCTLFGGDKRGEREAQGGKTLLAKYLPNMSLTICKISELDYSY